MHESCIKQKNIVRGGSPFAPAPFFVEGAGRTNHIETRTQIQIAPQNGLRFQKNIGRAWPPHSTPSAASADAADAAGGGGRHRGATTGDAPDMFERGTTYLLGGPKNGIK